MYVYKSVCAYESSAYGSQEWSLSSLELELQAVVSCLTWVLGIELGPLNMKQVSSTAEPSLLSPASETLDVTANLAWETFPGKD